MPPYRTAAEIAKDIPPVPKEKKPINWKPLRRLLAWVVLFCSADLGASTLVTAMGGPPWHWGLFVGSLIVVAAMVFAGLAVRWSLLELQKQ